MDNQWRSAPEQRAKEVLDRIKGLVKPVVIEVGVNRAAMARIILRENPYVEYYMVDNWLSADDTRDEYKATRDNNALRDQRRAQQDKREALRIADSFSPRVHIREGFSTDMAATFASDFADVVFIDADHSYKGVKEDIEAWERVSRKWIGGHDYQNNDPKFDFSGVEKAVHEFYDEVQVGLNFTWWKCLSAS